MAADLNVVIFAMRSPISYYNEIGDLTLIRTEIAKMRSGLPASVAQWAEAQCAPAGTVCRRGGVQSLGRPVDFVFGFQGRIL